MAHPYNQDGALFYVTEFQGQGLDNQEAPCALCTVEDAVRAVQVEHIRLTLG